MSIWKGMEEISSLYPIFDANGIPRSGLLSKIKKANFLYFEVLSWEVNES